MVVKRWTAQQDNLINKHFKYNAEHIFTLKCFTGCTEFEVFSRAIQLGLVQRTWKPWLLEEDEVIIKCYPEYGTAYCARYLIGRTEIAIQSRALKLGVNRDLSKRKNELPVGNVMDTDKLAYNGKWRKDK